MGRPQNSATGRPQCKLCGAKHWSDEPHQWPDRPAESILRGAREALEHARVTNTSPNRTHKPSPNKVTSPNVSPNKQVSGYERNKRWREQNRDRYNSYQREYMRQRRAGSHS